MMTPLTTQRLFGVGLLAGGIVLVGFVAGIVGPTGRFWPHGGRDWTFWLGWTAWTRYVGNLLGVAYRDWWSSYWPPDVALAIGALLVVAVVTVGTAAALGAANGTTIRRPARPGGFRSG